MSLDSLAGRVALVTGATRGIGRPIAERLAEAGVHVAVGYGRNEELALELAGELEGRGVRAAAVGGDLALPETAGRMVAEAEAALGPVDVLVANAGIAPVRPFDEIALEEWDEVMAVNLRASFLLAQAVVPGMRERRFGRIVFLSSVAAYIGGVIGAHYAASKAGLHGLMHFLARSLASHGVTVNAVVPAFVESDMLPGGPELRSELLRMLPVGRFGQPDEVADLVMAVLANAYLTNQSLSIDGGAVPR